MGKSLADALAKAGVVSKESAYFVEEMRRQALRAEERVRAKLAAGRVGKDTEELQNRERFLRTASRETVRPGGNTATKAYLKRFT